MVSLSIRHRGGRGASLILLVKLLRDEGIDVHLKDAEVVQSEPKVFNSIQIHDIVQAISDTCTILRLPDAALSLMDGVRRAVVAIQKRYPDQDTEILDDDETGGYL